MPSTYTTADDIKQHASSIDLSRGWPAPQMLPSRIISEASARTLADPAKFVSGLQYGDDLGYYPLRAELSLWLSNVYERPPQVDRICLTAGASLGLANILQSFTEPTVTQAIWVMAPCYFLACAMFEDAGFHSRLKAVPEGDDGPDIELLQKRMQEIEVENRKLPKPNEPTYKSAVPAKKFYQHIIYVVAISANPSGRSMPLRKRESLVRLAREHDALIICDDVYEMLQWPILKNIEEAPVQDLDCEHSFYKTFSPVKLPQSCLQPRLCDIDAVLGPSEHDLAVGLHFGHAVSNSSFSKVLGPGMRTGWVEGTPAFALGLSRTGSTISGGSPCQFSAMIISEIMRGGCLTRHLDYCVRPWLQRRHCIVVQAVQEHLAPLDVSFVHTSLAGGDTFGGYFLWLTLPPGNFDAEDLTHYAKTIKGVVVSTGKLFEVPGDNQALQFRQNIRLCFAWESEQNIIEGIRQLATILQEAR